MIYTSGKEGGTGDGTAATYRPAYVYSVSPGNPLFTRYLEFLGEQNRRLVEPRRGSRPRTPKE
jgi:hypothetical protein